MWSRKGCGCDLEDWADGLENAGEKTRPVCKVMDGVSVRRDGCSCPERGQLAFRSYLVTAGERESRPSFPAIPRSPLPQCCLQPALPQPGRWDFLLVTVGRWWPAGLERWPRRSMLGAGKGSRLLEALTSLLYAGCWARSERDPERELMRVHARWDVSHVLCSSGASPSPLGVESVLKGKQVC